ncbi:MAG: LuxR C-terminal-related transcriptional regulator [Candidatus Acidiferrum sp.]
MNEDVNAISEALGNLEQFTAGVFGACEVGVAVFDSSLRFVAVNGTIANLHGIPIKMHKGRTLDEVLGAGAALVSKQILCRVLYSGKSMTNIEIAAKMPVRTDVGYWIMDFFPIKDATGTTIQVGVLSTEITEQKVFKECVGHLVQEIPVIRDQLTCTTLPEREGRDRLESWLGSIKRLESCLEYLRECMIRFHVTAGEPDSLRPNPQQSLSFLSLNMNTQNDWQASSEADTISGAQPNLSSRDHDIIRLVASGKSNKEIASALEITLHTVQSYRERVLLKLNLHSTVDLVRYAIRHGIVRA